MAFEFQTVTAVMRTPSNTQVQILEGYSGATTPDGCIMEEGKILKVKSSIKHVLVQFASAACKNCPLLDDCTVGSVLR